MIYRPEIDGLRALAVLPVVLFHAGIPGFAGGFVGVDIFFVISGYLITTIIITDIQAEKFSLLDFYARRARRIVPALVAVILFCIPLSFLLMTGSELRSFFQSLVAVVSFAANIFFFLTTDYFAPDAELSPMLHTWSLAVEEQFYLFFPLLLLLLSHKFPLHIAVIFTSLTIISLVAYAVGRQIAPMATFYLLPTRIWELMAGALCAFSIVNLRVTRIKHLDSMGLTLIVVAILFAGDGAVLDGFGLQLSVLGAVLVILYAGPGTLVTRVLGWAPLVAIGLVSYSAYLWHQPLLAFARLSTDDLTISYVEALSLVALTFILAMLSWKFIEQPFRRRAHGADWKTLVSSGAVLTCIALVGLAGHVTRGFEAFRSPSEIWTQLERTIEVSPMRAICHERTPERPSVPNCIYPEGNLRFAVLGNSHGVELAWGLAEALEGSGSALLHKTVSACRVGLTRIDTPVECRLWMADAVDEILSHQEIEAVILSFYMDETGREQLQHLAEIVELLRAAGKDVIVVLQAPSLKRHIEWVANNRVLNAAGNLPGRTLDNWHRIAPTLIEAQNILLHDVIVVDPADYFCVEGQCLASLRDRALYYDSHHMTVFAAGIVSPYILGAISEMSRTGFSYTSSSAGTMNPSMEDRGGATLGQKLSMP